MLGSDVSALFVSPSHDLGKSVLAGRGKVISLFSKVSDNLN